MKKYTIEELQLQRESEDHVEFKKAENGNFSYNGASKMDPKDRRKCILGYVDFAILVWYNEYRKRQGGNV